MRSSIGGWVENRLRRPPADSGLAMYMCAVAGLASAARLGICCVPACSLASAEASHSGWPEISAPMRSASYSRPRLIAIWTSAAASGARIMAAMATIGLTSGRPSESRPPPIMPPKLASMPMAPESVAATVMISVSRWRTWLSSCAITPAISSRLRWRSRPVVAATAAFSGLRPVAKALGCSSSIT